jgi:hypothetical protein
MKFQVTFKCPDALFNALQDLDSEKKEQAKELAERFIQYDECVEVEFDTEKGTATVLEV